MESRCKGDLCIFVTCNYVMQTMIMKCNITGTPSNICANRGLTEEKLLNLIGASLMLTSLKF